MASTDRELFRLIAGKNERAFNKIYHTYHPVLFSCVKRMLKSNSYAEDTVHDVFIKLWLGGEELKRIQNPSGWLLRLAANQTLDYLRQEQTRRQRDQLLKFMNKGYVSEDEEIALRELQRLLQKAIMQLPLDTGVILRASIEQGLSRRQIAERLGLSVSTVKNKLEAGRRFLREYLLKHAGVYLPWVLVAGAMMK